MSFLRALNDLLVAEEVQEIGSVRLLYYRNDHLAGDISSENQNISLIEFGGVDELQETNL